MMRTTTAGPMTATAATSSPRWRALLTRGAESSERIPRPAVELAGLVGAAMVAASAGIHLHLWQAGYKNIHLIGPAFLAQACAGFVLAVCIAVYRRFVSFAAGALYAAGSIAALLLSATVGFLGIHDALNVPWANWSLVTEGVALAMFVVALTALVWRRP